MKALKDLKTWAWNHPGKAVAFAAAFGITAFIAGYDNSWELVVTYLIIAAFWVLCFWLDMKDVAR